MLYLRQRSVVVKTGVFYLRQVDVVFRTDGCIQDRWMLYLGQGKVVFRTDRCCI